MAVALVSLFCVAAAPPTWKAEEGRIDRAQRSDGPVYFIGEFIPQYEQPAPSLPPLDEIEDIDFEMGRTLDGYVAPRPGVRTIRFRFSQLADAPTQRFYASGVRQVNKQIVQWLNARGIVGVRVRPHPSDIEPGTNRDLRERDETRLRLVIAGGQVEPEAELEPRVRADERDGPVYPIDEIMAEYAEHHAHHPALAELDRVWFELGRTFDGYVAPRPGVPSVQFRMAQLTAAPVQYIYASGLRSINEQIVAWLNSRGLVGVLVRPHEEDIDPDSNEDLRREGDSSLRLLVWTGRVKELRTFASGKRVPQEGRVDNPAHQPIKQTSPVKPGALRGQDLVNKHEIDDYLARLNRHPGRRVDVALSPGLEPGAVNVEYMVAENKPWTAYAQWSNTGTDQTTDSRQRFGFTHTQLTGRDDVLSLNYLTGNFDEVNAVFGSYAAPFLGHEWLRWRIDGNYSQYDASTLGSVSPFEGEQSGGGLEFVANVYQHREFFLDLFGGGRFANIRVDNPLALSDADDSFILPRAGVRATRKNEWSALLANLELEVNYHGLSGNDVDDPKEMGGLGRFDPDEDWAVMRWDTSWSTYLEPWFDPDNWKDATTPETSTLASEVAFSFRGQYAFDNRLIPQEQRIAGGFYTVRGYDQAEAAGDSVFIGSAEYRFHIPRVLSPGGPITLPVFGDFHVVPESVYARPDWDLILRTFVDGARVLQSGDVPGEHGETLLSAGLGLELQLWRNLVGRMDWGMALRDSDRLGVDRGDNEVHLSVTTLY